MTGRCEEAVGGKKRVLLFCSTPAFQIAQKTVSGSCYFLREELDRARSTQESTSKGGRALHSYHLCNSDNLRPRMTAILCYAQNPLTDFLLRHEIPAR